MSLDILNPLTIKKHKTKGGFCLIRVGDIDNFRYSPIYNDFGLVTNSWTKLNDIGNIKSASCVAYDGKLYIFGGSTDGSNPISHAAYFEPDFNLWTVFSGDGIARMGHMIVYEPTSQTFMSFGGTISGGSISNAVRSAPVSNPSSWGIGNPAYTPMPTGRSGITGGIWNGSVYCWGGGQNNMAVYNVAENSWTTPANSVTPTFIPLAATIDTENGIMYQAGWLNGESTMSVWACSLESGATQYIWNKLVCNTTKPLIRQRHTLIYIDGVLYMIGGRLLGTGMVANEIWAYNVTYNTWSKLTMDNLKVGTEYAASEVLSNKIYIIGGNTNTGTIVSDVHSYDLLKNYGMAIRLMRD